MLVLLSFLLSRQKLEVGSVLAGAIFPLEFEIAMGNGQACMRAVGNLTMLMTGIGRLPPFTILPIKMQMIGKLITE